MGWMWAQHGLARMLTRSYIRKRGYHDEDGITVVNKPCFTRLEVVVDSMLNVNSRTIENIQTFFHEPIFLSQ
uniref:Uncharacterized protein n=1 Tax=Rhizophora mucronata TaxID=61149 RepID=A0A2P2J481_RHIMU